jgi:hypothetical protein
VLEGLADARYSVSARKPGYVTAILKDVDAASTQTLTLTLKAGGSISGRVTGLSEGDLGGVRINVSASMTSASGQTDSTGAFRVDGIPDGVATVVAGCPGRAVAGLLRSRSKGEAEPGRLSRSNSSRGSA